ncbi:hypothetical protein NQM15_003187 [Salmonella enterica]|nr:hypothetical protein [Salmonella enterica]
MTTITRERLKQIYAECEERDPAIFEIRELVRIALASCDARPEGYIHIKALNDMRDRSSLLGRVWVDDTGSGDCVPLYAAPPSPVAPDGYALVPVEPTDEMIAAAMDSDDVTYNESDDTVFYVHHCEIYKAMLAAAPKPEANNE